MKFLPAPPTDNLYKYAAITGLWLSLGFSALFVYFIDTSNRLQDYYQHSLWVHKDKQFIDSAEKRIRSLQANKEQENKMEYISDTFDASQELVFLKNSIPLVQRKIEENTNAMAKLGDPESDWKRFERAFLGAWLPAAIGLSLLLSYGGFRLWYGRTQKRADELLVLELEYKREALRQIHRSRWKKN